MARRAIIVGTLALISTYFLEGCGAPNTKSYRFRMTVEVDTQQGIKTGASVMEVRVKRGMAIGDRSGVSSQLVGEAVVVDLPTGPIFVLLKLPDGGPPLLTVVGDALRGRRSETPEAVMADTASLGSTWFSAYKAEGPRRRDLGANLRKNGGDDSNWPMIVRFRDVNDPKSVEKVSPDAIGVKRIWVETTTDDVTMGIEMIIPWIDHLDHFLSDPKNPFTSTLPQDFGGFRSGVR